MSFKVTCLRITEGTTPPTPPLSHLFWAAPWLVTSLPLRFMYEYLEGSRRHHQALEQKGKVQPKWSPFHWQLWEASRCSIGWNERWTERMWSGSQQVSEYVPIDLKGQREALPSDFFSRILTRGWMWCREFSSPVRSLPWDLKWVLLLPHTQSISESRLYAPWGGGLCQPHWPHALSMPLSVPATQQILNKQRVSVKS